MEVFIIFYDRKEIKILKHFRKREPSSTELTWEEKNPTSYLYCSSEVIEKVREMVEKNEKSGSINSVQKGRDEASGRKTPHVSSRNK